MKHMKNLLKVASMLAVAILLMLNSTKNAKAAEDMVIVYAQVPDDWNEPCVWAWSEDGTNAFETWPGGAMTKDENNDGWYYVYVPTFVSSIIVNANEGTVQTLDLVTNSENVWVTVASPEEAILTNEQLTNGDLPSFETMITINIQAPTDWTLPCLWAWSAPDGTNVFANWPGQELEESADGWYSYEVPSWVNSIIVNGNLGEVQTPDITIEAKDVWIVIADAENYTLAYEKPVEEVATEDLIAIHAKVPSDWLLPSLWAWSAPDGTNAFVNWPGEELVLEDEWYTYSVPNWVNSIILNGNLGEIQTTDIAIEAKDVWVVVTNADTFEVYYEEPAETVEVTADDIVAEEVPEEIIDEDNNTLIVIGIIIVAILAIGGGAFVINKKKNK